MQPAEVDLSELQKELFEVPWADCREKLGADIEGNMSQSIIESHKILNCKCCEPVSVFDNNIQKPTDVEGPSKRDEFKEA